MKKMQHKMMIVSLKSACYIVLIVTAVYIEPALADWFNTDNVKVRLIDKSYNFIDNNLGYIAFAVGGASTFLARGGDFWQKGMAFGAGALGTACSVVAAKALLGLE